jgi:hypothetical protein
VSIGQIKSVKSVSGNDVVERNYTYGVEAQEANYASMLWEREEIGNVGELSALGGPVWRKTISNWVGEKVFEESPQATGAQSGTFRVEWTYDLFTGERTGESRNGAQWSTSSFDVATNTNTETRYLSSSGPAIVSTAVETMVLDGGAWYRQRVTADGTARTQATNFSWVSGLGMLRSHVKVTSSAGDVSEQWEYVDRAAKLVTQRTLVAGATNYSEQRIRNGLLEASKTPSVTALTVNTYDGVGRLIVSGTRSASIQRRLFTVAERV